MKLALKIALAVTLVIAAVLGADGFIRVRRQVETFENDTGRDHLSMGRATAAAVAEAWLVYGESSAMGLMDRIGKKTRRVSVRWIPERELATRPLPDGFSATEIGAILDGESISHLRAESGVRRMVTLVPVRPEKKTVGAIEISESLAGQTAQIRASVVQSAAITLTAISICAAATILLGFWLIGRPIRKLVRQAEAIGKGNFEFRVPFSGRDEISELSFKMNEMAKNLRSATRRIERETTAHVRTLEQLRHADRLKTVGQLTSSVVHEVGTPLNVIAGRAKMIQCAEAEGEEAIECARIVVEQAEKVTRTVRRILDFARISPGERRVRDVTETVTDMVQLLTPVAVKNGIYLAYDSEAEYRPARIDADQIQQVLANLIINAVQAGSSGGHVTVRIDEAHCAGEDAPDADAVPAWAISVEDDGCGIDPESMPRIFESFFTTKAAGNGTGLGLPISQEIVREHGGRLLVESEPGKGSTFTVCLPKEDA